MLDDLGFAWRRLRHSPGFAALAIVTLAVAIGANTAIFSIADAVLFRPLPYDEPERIQILRLLNRATGRRFTSTPYEYLQAIHEHHRGLSEVGLLESAPSILAQAADGAERIPVVAVSASYFPILGVRAVRGRVLDARDGSQPGRAAMLSYVAWRQRFAGDEHIAGRSITLGATTLDIVGVLPAGFVFPSQSAGKPDVIILMEPLTAGAPGGTFHPIVRLEPGVTRDQAQAEIDSIVSPLAALRPGQANTTVVMEDVRSIIYPTGQPIMRFLLVAAGLVLLIGCANMANMLLARTQRRERESGVRAALGASRLRLIRPVIFESILIGLAGAALAVLVTSATFDALLRHVPRVAYGTAPVGVDGRVAVFALALGLLSGLIFAVVPAWRSGRMDVQALLQGRHRAPRMRRGPLGAPMIALQVALAVVLVFGAVIASRAFVSVLRVPLGFAPDNVLTIGVWPAERGAALQAFYVRAVEAMAQRGDVISAGAAGSMPLDSRASDEGVFVTGERAPHAGIVHALPGYFQTVGIRLVRGRLLDPDDVRNGADVSVVSESAARVMFPGRDGLGGTFDNGRGRQFTVVGIISDVVKSLDREASAPAYVIPADATRAMTIVVRARARRGTLLPDIKREISALAPGTPVSVAWWSDSISALTAYRNPRFQMIVLVGFAALALALTAVGIFAIVSFLVTIRTREMGIRLAIGATPHSLVALMVRQALVPVVVGLIIGALSTRWLARLAEAQLFAVQTRDPMTIGAAAVTVVAAALLAAYLPARRASRVDPVVVLRAE